MPWTAKAAATRWLASTSIFASTQRPSPPPASRSRMGESCLHGPHQSAQKSMSTGTRTERFMTSVWKVSSVTAMTYEAPLGAAPPEPRVTGAATALRSTAPRWVKLCSCIPPSCHPAQSGRRPANLGAGAFGDTHLCQATLGKESVHHRERALHVPTLSRRRHGEHPPMKIWPDLPQPPLIRRTEPAVGLARLRHAGQALAHLEELGIIPHIGGEWQDCVPRPDPGGVGQHRPRNLPLTGALPRTHAFAPSRAVVTNTAGPSADCSAFRLVARCQAGG